jgi:ribosomal protein L25 (general stress protein Ctc)
MASAFNAGSRAGNMSGAARMLAAASAAPSRLMAGSDRALGTLVASRMTALSDMALWASSAASGVVRVRVPAASDFTAARQQSTAAVSAGSATKSAGGGLAPPQPSGAGTKPAAAAGAPRALFGQQFTVGKIHALPRSATGSRSAQWARVHGMIPGIIYGYDAEGRDAVDLIYVRESDLRREVNVRGPCFMNTLYDMCVPGVCVCVCVGGGGSDACHPACVRQP